MKVKNFVRIIPAVLALLLFAGCGGTKPLKVGVSRAALPPMVYEDESGALTGFDVELAGLIGEGIGREIEFVKVEWSDREAALKDKTADLLIGGVTVPETENADYLYSKAYLTLEQVVVTTGEKVNSSDELAGKVVAVLKDSPSYTAFGMNSAFRDSIETWSAFGRVEDLFASLASGDADAVICDRDTALYQQGQDASLQISDDSVAESAYCVEMRRADEKLFTEVQKALDDIATNGTGKQLSEKWFGTNLYYR